VVSDYLELRDRLLRAAKAFLGVVRGVEEVVIVRGRGGVAYRCSISTRRGRAVVTIQTPKEGFSVEELAVACIESAGRQARVLNKVLAYTSIPLALAILLLIPQGLPEGVKVPLQAAITALAGFATLVGGARGFVWRRGFKRAVARYRELVAIDGLSSEVFKALTELLEELLRLCGDGRVTVGVGAIARRVRERCTQVLALLEGMY